MAEKYLQMEHDQMPRERLEELTMGSLRKAVFEGDAENGSLMAGQIAGIIHEVQPVAIIIEEMFNEADEVRAKLPLSFLPK
ncbi:enoyl-(acyl-carrier-protein) reductase [Enterococcus canis]|uniref:Enoyl-(Acyl-carrier-protein) reductase n=1 Tax=Enterococcus canis TaxID=214095 RepID=A0A1L8RHS8_9ENTE|nr:enoyl-(acyl-carrier-protein) reductase [Enterococcus canis]